MKPEQQIKALAELDGFVHELCDDSIEISVYRKSLWMDGRQVVAECLPNYLTSYDAIIPLIQQLSAGNAGKVLHEHIEDLLWTLYRLKYMTQATPAQLCEALLRATGKWIE